jgi:hypothetical protein
MQATLLVMCFVWRHRQHKLGIDDFGHPLHDGDELFFEESRALGGAESSEADINGDDTEGGEDTPLLKNVNGSGTRWRAFKWMKGRRS